MVDDGSADGSAAIAQAQAAADPRFTLLRVPNGGPGYARNRGIEPPAASSWPSSTATTCCPATPTSTCCTLWRRPGPTLSPATWSGSGRPGSPSRPCMPGRSRAGAIGTHISRAPNLFYDVSVWNKLFRRSFWDSAGLTFPEGVVWEDLQTITKAHVLARAVDVISRHDLLLARARAGRAVDHPVAHRHRQLPRPDHRAAGHRRLPARARGRQAAAPASAQGAGQRPVAVRVRAVADQRRLPRRVHRRRRRLPARRWSGRVLRSLPAAHKLAYYLIGHRAAGPAGQVRRLAA